jgi:negative regulator of sigma E activity
MKTFIAEAVPNAAPATQSFAAEFVMATISALGKHVSEKDGTGAQLEQFAAATSDMLCDWLAQKNRR